MSELKQSINGVQIVGTLKEINLTLDGVKKREIGKDRISVECDAVVKKDFKNPAFTVESNGQTIGVDIAFGVNEKMVDKDGNVVDNSKFKELKTIMETYVCGETRVKVDAQLSPNEYATAVQGSDEYEFKSLLPRIDISGMYSHMTSSNVPDADTADGDISGVISKIAHEVRGEEETGRLNVELYAFDYKGATYPINFTVEEDLASDFESYYEVNNSVHMCYEVKVVQHGAPKASSGGFGRRETNRVSGYLTTEFSVFRGDDPYEEESEYYVDGETMTTALNEREQMKAERIAKKKESDAKGGTATVTHKSPSGAGVGKASPFGAPKTATVTAKKSPF